VLTSSLERSEKRLLHVNRRTRRTRLARAALPTFCAFAVVCAAELVSPESRAQGRIKDSPEQGQGSESVPDKDKDPLRGSTFLFDQSMSTQTAHLENAEQSNVPFYGWWLSLRPRWNFDDHWSARLRLDYYKEFTNSQDTTYYREDVFGDIWTDLVYSTPLQKEGRWKNTKVSLGLRALWPTSKQSQANGTYVTLGATAGVNQKFPINGESARFMNSAHLAVSAAYLHAFTQAQTAGEYGNFQYTRENVDGYSFVSDQLTGQPLTNHQVYAIFDSGLQVTPKVSLTLDWILINNWHYAAAGCVQNVQGVPGGQVCPGQNPVLGPDQTFTQLGWFIFAGDYEVIPEMSIGLGYYNLTNTIAPDGTVRTPFAGGFDNVFWSPDARVYLDVTANLDRIFEAATGKYKTGSTAQAAQAARQQRVISGLR
jgi:hypothetical protein